MARLLGHGTAKYVTGERTATSAGLGWRDVLAERWRHAEGDLGEIVPRETEVIVMLEGRLKVRRRGDGRLQHHDAAAGTVWLCPAGISEDMIRLYGPILDCVHLYLPAQPLSRAVLQELNLDPAHTALRYEGGFRDATVEAIARTVASALRDEDPISRLLVETMSAALGVHLVRNYSNKPAASTRLPQTRGALDAVRLGRVTALLEARLGEDVSLADLAREASLSPFHFARCFKAATGMSPHRYLLERRMQRARDLLTGADASLADIAADCGFCSQAHFTSAFKRQAGVTPGVFRAGRRPVLPDVRTAASPGPGSFSRKEQTMIGSTGLPGRRAVLGAMGAAWAAAATGAATARAEDVAILPLAGGPSARPISAAFPQKGAMIVQRTRPALLETPLEVFDQGVFTPNESFFVRWHWAAIPEEIDADTFRLAVRGQVNGALSLSLDELAAMPRVELAAVNQCSGNSRGLFAPRVAGGQWANGAMGNARWSGVRLKDVLDRAGVKAGAVQVRFDGLDAPLADGAPDFQKSLDIDHARDGEVMIAYAMNGEQLPLLNGFPLRLVVPGWYSTYWVKMLSDIEVLDHADDQYWMKTAYRIPDTPNADVKPGESGFATTPISRMNPRSFTTSLKPGQTVAADAAVAVRGIALGGDSGVARVELSTDGGGRWRPAELGADEGRYSFRRWTATVSLPRGDHALMVRCTNTAGVTQPAAPNWNPGGFMQNGIETIPLTAA